jgi:lysozyme family protein
MKMNVMKRAWEIAKEGQRKFGGKVKEYFAQALRIAWAEVKKGAKRVMEIGYTEIARRNGVLWFAVNDIEGLEVSLLEEKNGMNGKYTKRNNVDDYKKAVNNKTNQNVRIFNFAINCGDIEIKLGDKMMVIENHI